MSVKWECECGSVMCENHMGVSCGSVNVGVSRESVNVGVGCGSGTCECQCGRARVRLWAWVFGCMQGAYAWCVCDVCLGCVEVYFVSVCILRVLDGS